MLKLKFAIVLVFLLFSANKAFATEQYPDKIIYDGREYSLHSNPMEDYFKRFPDKLPKTGFRSTALWRGYVATFEIVDNELFLKDLEIRVKKNTTDKLFDFGWQSVLKDVVQDGKKLKIDWFTGILTLPYGNIVNYVHMGYASTYENYILIEVENGDFKKEKKFNAEQYANFKERQFEAFKKTDEYKKIVEELKKKENMTDEFIESFLKDFVISYSTKILVD